MLFRNVVATGPASDGVRGSRVAEQEGRRAIGGVGSHVVVELDGVSSVAARFLLNSPRRVPSSGCDAACVVSADRGSSQVQQDDHNIVSAASSETDLLRRIGTRQ